VQDHARGLLAGNDVNRKLYNLLEESLEYKSTLEYLSSAHRDIKAQKEEVRCTSCAQHSVAACHVVHFILHLSTVLYS
jgi:hypothetical protein